MSDYTQITSFGPKDALTTGDPNKRIRGSQLDPEFAAIAAAIQSKFDSVDIASNAEAAALTGDSKLITPGKLAHALQNGTLTLGSGISLAGTATFPNVAGAVNATHTELNILAGVDVTSAALNQIGSYVYKTANTSRPSTTTPTDDPHLTMAVEASSVYAIEMFWKFSTSGSTGGFKYAFGLPTGATFDAEFDATESSGSNYEFVVDSTSSHTGNVNSGATTRVVATIKGQLTTTDAGTFAFRWSQVSSDAAATIVYAGAWLKVSKIA